MERPFGLTLIAILFFMQGIGVLASAFRADSPRPAALAVAAAAALVFLATGYGVGQMRRWGRTLAIGITITALLLALLLRVAGIPPLLLFVQMVVGGLMLIYLFTHPSKGHFR